MYKRSPPKKKKEIRKNLLEGHVTATILLLWAKPSCNAHYILWGKKVSYLLIYFYRLAQKKNYSAACILIYTNGIYSLFIS